MSLVTQEIKASATYVYYGDVVCQEQSKLLLTEMGLPNGLITLEGMKEVGYIKETGFVWLIQKKPNKTKNKKIGKLTSNAVEVTAFIEKFKIKKLTGVKAKELLIWIPITEIVVGNPLTGKITFKTSYGICKSYPVSAFEINDVKKDVRGVIVAKDYQS
ncbi:uncharacterized protein LOC143566451 [Bidens hawaiensis]|uniref:uncharacterized protein LOC143566451 n=1 Tax=Bidens hawaiensis TaxID=980011 RepID=UPI00404A9758